jgi:hypothetical protein
MDSRHFDALTKTLFAAGTRRGVLGALASLPVVGELIALFNEDEADGQGRRQRRKKRRRRRRKHHKNTCKPQSKAMTCAGTCGLVKNNCKMTVNCGFCPTGQCCSGDGTCGACLVFVTSDAYLGNLGGLSGADAHCQGLADGARLPGEYRAWLSDGSGSPSTRLVQATVPYKRTDGVIIANNWADLIDGPLAASISRDESGAGQVGQVVWTNTTTTGTLLHNRWSCVGWTDDTSEFQGGLGEVDATNAWWTDRGVLFCGGFPSHLYCFQQR